MDEKIMASREDLARQLAGPNGYLGSQDDRETANRLNADQMDSMSLSADPRNIAGPSGRPRPLMRSSPYRGGDIDPGSPAYEGMNEHDYFESYYNKYKGVPDWRPRDPNIDKAPYRPPPVNNGKPIS